jgi:HK97 family phage prohead protease
MKMKKKQQPNQREIRTVAATELRVATREDGSKVVSGYAITYNSQSVDLGGFTEIVAPGALTRTLKDNPDVLCLRDHKSELLLGRTIAETLTLDDQPTGLHFICTLPNTSAGNDLAESLSRGDISGCSFGFSVANDTWTDDAQGNIIRTLLDIDLYEISITSFPAYPATSAALRTAPREIWTRLEQRDDAETDAACLCECLECVDGNCDDCSDADCTDEQCSCDMRSQRLKQHLELRLHLMEMESAAL